MGTRFGSILSTRTLSLQRWIAMETEVYFYFVEDLCCGAEMSEDGADANGVPVSPVHACLFL